MTLIKNSFAFLFSVVLFLCDLAKFSVNGNPNGRVVSLPQGLVKGRLSETRNGSYFMEYMGIPYATYNDRFKRAYFPPPPLSDNHHDGTFRRDPCYQMKGNITIGREDCLYLNVATPANHNNYWMLKNMPVIVVFHGGSWMIDRGDWVGGDGGQWGAKHMMDEKVVIVTVNYRLGVFGFFTLFGYPGPANLGLKDQVEALKWVRANIAHFGGDPNTVTICGQGAGAASVGLHLLSPMSKGLFHRAIMQSGSPLCHWALVDDHQRASFNAFMEKVECDGDTKDTAEILNCLRNKDASELEYARQQIMHTHSDPFYPFGPVVEHWVRSTPRLQVFLPDYPHNILLNASNETWGGIPIMMGVNTQDGLNFVTGQYIYAADMKDFYFGNINKSYPSNFGYGLSRELPAAMDEASQNEVTEKIRNFYYPNVSLDAMKERAYYKTHIDMYSHRNHFQCVKNAAILYGRWSEIYLYYWTRAATSFKKWHDYDKLNLTGLANGDEVHFLFDNAENYGDFSLIRYFRDKHLAFSQNMVKLWIKFAGDGKPVDEWKTMKGQDKSSLQWYELKESPRVMIPEPFTNYTDFWDSLNLDNPRELPPANEVYQKGFSRKDKGEDDDDNGFIYVDLDNVQK